MTEEQERAAFEAEMVPRYGLRIQRGPEGYRDLAMDVAWSAWKARAARSQPASPVPEAPTVEQAISSLVTALAASKGWMRDYADSVVRDAIERKAEAEHVWLKCDACGRDMRGHDRLVHCSPAPEAMSVEQRIRNALDCMEIPGAQNYSAGDLVELSNLVRGIT